MTRKYSCRMHTTCLPTGHTFATRCQYWQRGPQTNKFEQVSSDGHQMSLAGAPGPRGVPCLMSWGARARARGPICDVQGAGTRTEEGALYNEIQCTMGNGHMGTPSPCQQTDTNKNMTFLQLRWRVVKMTSLSYCSGMRWIFIDTHRLPVTFSQ